MDTPLAELEQVIFIRESPHDGHPGLPRNYAKVGDFGTIVHVHTIPRVAYIVEIREGIETIALVTVTPEYVTPYQG